MSRVPDNLRGQVRQRAGERCEYCLKPEGVSSYAHHADHIVAVKHDGATTLDNLAWTCFQCNTNKGSDLTTFDPETRQLVRLFNPRTQRWGDHFELQEALIVGLTPIGRATVFLITLTKWKPVLV